MVPFLHLAESLSASACVSRVGRVTHHRFSVFGAFPYSVHHVSATFCSLRLFVFLSLVASPHRAARHNECAPAPARVGLQPPFRRDESTPYAMDGRGGACAAAAARRGLSCAATTLAESRAALRATTAGASFGAFSGGARGRRRGECIALPGSRRCVGLHRRRAPRTPRDRGS